MSVRLSLWLLVAACGFSRMAFGEDASAPRPTVLSVLDFPVRAVMDLPDFFRQVDPRDHAATYLWITALTGGLILADQPIIDESQRFAYRIGLINEGDDGRETRVIMHNSIFGIGANIHVPESPNTYMYYLGDGITSFMIVGGLLSYGSFADNGLAIHAASQVLEAIALTGIFSITLKMSSGRESPFRATQDGGKWRGFVGFKNYLKDVSKHDAYPSGHIATLMATVRVLAENYLDKTWILPLGYTSMGLLMWAMLNNGVHWASDYPLGIAVGYNAAGVVLNHHLGKDRGAAPPSPVTSGPLGNVTLSAQDGYVVVSKLWEL